MRFSRLRSTVWIDEEADEYRLSYVPQHRPKHRLGLLRGSRRAGSRHHTLYRVVKLQHRMECLCRPLGLLERFHDQIIAHRELMQADEGCREERLELN